MCFKNGHHSSSCRRVSFLELRGWRLTPSAIYCLLATTIRWGPSLELSSGVIPYSDPIFYFKFFFLNKFPHVLSYSFKLL